MNLYTVANGDIIQAQDIDQVVNWLQHFVVNAYDYGALPTNTAAQNDTAFAAGINAVGSRGTLYIPPGIYSHNGISLTAKTDVSIMGLGPGTILAPTAGNTAITITDCIRCNVSGFKIDGSINSGATGISISGDFDAHIFNMHFNGLSGDAIYVNGDAAIGNEIHFSHIVSRANGGWGYNYERTTTTDHGGMYLTDYLCVRDTQGVGGFRVFSSAGASTGVFHFMNHCLAENYSNGPAAWIHNVNHVYMTRLWCTTTNNAGPSLLIDGDGWFAHIDGAYINNGGTGAGTYCLTVNDTFHDSLWNDITFDGANVTDCVHIGSSGANLALGQYNLFGGKPLTDTALALYNKSGFSQQYGPALFLTPGNSGAQCFGIDDANTPGQAKYIRNFGGSFQMFDKTFTNTLFRVDDSGFMVNYGGLNISSVLGGATIYGGSGAPGGGVGSNGDFYFRSDGGASTHLYFKAGGTWSGIV